MIMSIFQSTNFRVLTDAIYLSQACHEIAQGNMIYPIGVAHRLSQNAELRAMLPLSTEQASAIAAYRDPHAPAGPSPKKDFKFTKPKCNIGIISHVDAGKSSEVLAAMWQKLCTENMKPQAVRKLYFGLNGNANPDIIFVEHSDPVRGDKYPHMHEDTPITPINAPLSEAEQAQLKAARQAVIAATPALAAALPGIIKAAALELKALGPDVVAQAFERLHIDAKYGQGKTKLVGTDEALRTIIEYAQPDVDYRVHELMPSVRKRAAFMGDTYITSLPLAPHAQPKPEPARERGSMAKALKLLP
jgi:hypothetical protein